MPVRERRLARQPRAARQDPAHQPQRDHPRRQPLRRAGQQRALQPRRPRHGRRDRPHRGGRLLRGDLRQGLQEPLPVRRRLRRRRDASLHQRRRRAAVGGGRRGRVRRQQRRRLRVEHLRGAPRQPLPRRPGELRQRHQDSPHPRVQPQHRLRVRDSRRLRTRRFQLARRVQGRLPLQRLRVREDLFSRRDKMVPATPGTRS
jgi:hypothetical protein